LARGNNGSGRGTLGGRGTGRGNALGAREIAYRVLSRVEGRGAFAEKVLDNYLSRHGVLTDSRDRALATELVYGVLRKRGLLDRALGLHLAVPPRRLDKEVARVLRLAAYQVLFLDKIPDRAAVDEAVRLAKRYCARGSDSLVNAVLRALCKGKESPSLQAILARPGRCGEPEWLARLWREELGADLAEALLENITHAPETILRVNTLKVTRHEFVEAMRARGLEIEPLPELSEAVRVRRAADMWAGAAGDLFRMGCYVQQDVASQLITWILDPRPGQKVLDCCAAPGIKTTHIGQRMGATGLLLALDRHAGRLRELVGLCRRMGVSNVVPICAEAATGHALLPIRSCVAFERILADVPCSGLGVLKRAPERKWRAAPDFGALASLQYRILEACAAHLERGGILVYSTCTVAREENERVIERFLSEREDFVLEDAAAFVPPAFRGLVCGRGMFRSWSMPGPWDFFFAARLRKV